MRFNKHISFGQQKNSVEEPVVSGLHEIAGLKSTKKYLHTLIVLPRHQPQLFQNRNISNSILLYGPPGTGKTRLVHALAAESGAQLYSISVSDLLGSYVGQTEKNIQGLFNYIRTKGEYSILFIDEIDGLCRKRSSSEHEYSRRIKTELMCQMTRSETCKTMIIISVTNCPWDLDPAILRRFQKRIYIPLPNSEERLELFKLFTKDVPIMISIDHWKNLIQKCEGFSGSDIAALVQDALDIPVTELQDTTIWKVAADGFFEPFEEETNLPPEWLNLEMDMEKICISELNDLPPHSVRAREVTLLDFLKAVEHFNVTVSREDVEKYEQFKSK